MCQAGGWPARLVSQPPLIQSPLLPPLAVMSGAHHSVPVGPNVRRRAMTWAWDEKNAHGWRGCEGGGWRLAAESRALRVRQPRRPSFVLSSWVSAGDITCRDGCRGVDDQRKPRSGASFLAGLGIKPISRLGRLNYAPSTRYRASDRDTDRHVTSSCCRVLRPRSKPKPKPDIREPMACLSAPTPSERHPETDPLYHGSCGRITPVTAGNDLAPFSRFLFSSRGLKRKEAKSVTGGGCHRS